MTRHLLDAGARHLAMIAGPADTSGGQERRAGFLDVLGPGADESLVVPADYTREGGARAARSLMETHPETDGLFVASDLMAAGAVEELRRAGRRVPEDVLVGGFDDSSFALTTEPALTTMRQPFRRISAEMVRLLLEAVEGQDPAAVILPTTLVVRGSTARV